MYRRKRKKVERKKNAHKEEEGKMRVAEVEIKNGAIGHHWSTCSCSICKSMLRYLCTECLTSVYAGTFFTLGPEDIRSWTMSEDVEECERCGK